MKDFTQLTPGTPEWMAFWKTNPDLQYDMLEYQKQLQGGTTMARTAGNARNSNSDRKARMQAMRQRAKEQAQEAASGGSNYIRLPDGVEYFALDFPKGKHKTTILVSHLPYISMAYNHADRIEPGADYYKKTYYRHADIGPDKLKIVCPAKTWNRPCPICDDITELMKDRDANEEIIDAIKPKQRNLFLNFDHEVDAKEETLYLWDISYHCYGKKLDSEIEELADDAPWFADPDDMTAVSARMTDEYYGNCDRLDFEPFKKPLPGWAADHGFDLNNFLVELSYDQILALYNGVDPEPADEPEPERERPARETTRRERHDPDPEPEKEKSSTRTRTRAAADPDPDPPADVCPYDFKFGIDFDTQRRCTKCEVRVECEKAAPPEEPAGDDTGNTGGHCPKGQRYGHDCNTSNFCKKCEIWADCDDEFERLNKK